MKSSNILYILFIVIVIIVILFYYKRQKSDLKPNNSLSTNITIKPTINPTINPTIKPTIKPTQTPTPRPTRKLIEISTTPTPTIPQATTTTLEPTPTPQQTYVYTSAPSSLSIVDAFSGSWNSNSFGRATFISQGDNTFNISYSYPVYSDVWKTIKVDPLTLNCTLPLLSYGKDLGKAVILNGKATKIGDTQTSIRFTRNFDDIINTPIPTTITPVATSYSNPFEGIWNSYRYGGQENGPVTIKYLVNDLFSILGVNIRNDYLKTIKIDPITLDSSLPDLGSYGYIGKAVIINGRAEKIIGSGISLVR
jgi:hypothetical protein